MTMLRAKINGTQITSAYDEITSCVVSLIVCDDYTPSLRSPLVYNSSTFVFLRSHLASDESPPGLLSPLASDEGTPYLLSPLASDEGTPCLLSFLLSIQMRSLFNSVLFENPQKNYLAYDKNKPYYSRDVSWSILLHSRGDSF